MSLKKIEKLIPRQYHVANEIILISVIIKDSLFVIYYYKSSRLLVEMVFDETNH